MRRRCLDCSGITRRGSRCPECQRAHERARYERRGGKAGKRWRLQVLAKDGWACVNCGSMTNLKADHILPVNSHPELALDPANGRTLCHSCHVKIGAR